MRGKVAAGAGIAGMGLWAARLLWVDKQVGRLTHQWAEHNAVCMQQWANNAPTVLALGDSSVQGVGAKRIEECFVSLFAAAVQAELEAPLELLNLSISGEVMPTLPVRQLTALDGIKQRRPGWQPDITIVCVGSNDVMNENTTVERFTYCTKEVSEGLPKGSFVANIPSFGVMPQEERAAEFSRILEDICISDGHHIVDIRGFTSSLGTADYALRNHAADLFHPNTKAYTQWARLFFEKWAEVSGHPNAVFAPHIFDLSDASDIVVA
jgi:Lysophospholipase L1 and related esterases